MTNTKLVVDTNLGIIDYFQVVNDIVLEYFDVEGIYQPHIGILNAMRVFYNICVKESKFDDEYNHNILDVFDMEDIIKDEDFIYAFNNAIDKQLTKLDFANAYAQALDIVKSKKTSFNNAVMVIRNVILEILNYMDGGI